MTGRIQIHVAMCIFLPLFFAKYGTVGIMRLALIFSQRTTTSDYWETIAKHKLIQFYSAPTAIWLLRRLGEVPACSGS